MDMFVFSSDLHLLVKLPLKPFSPHKLTAACCDATSLIGQILCLNPSI